MPQQHNERLSKLTWPHHSTDQSLKELRSRPGLDRVQAGSRRGPDGVQTGQPSSSHCCSQTSFLIKVPHFNVSQTFLLQTKQLKKKLIPDEHQVKQNGGGGGRRL